MFILLFFFFLLLTLFFLFLSKRKLSISIGLLTIALFIFVGSGFSPRVLLNYLQKIPTEKNIAWKEENTLILLGAGISQDPYSQTNYPSVLAFSRLNKTAILYRACREGNHTCHVLISGGDPLKKGHTEASVYRKQLIALGVDQHDIQLETKSTNTFQNAQFCQALLITNPPDQGIVLVSSAFALKRTLTYFAYFGVHPQPIAADFITIPISIWPLAYNFVMTDLALHEIIGLLQFKAYNLLGWNRH